MGNSGSAANSETEEEETIKEPVEENNVQYGETDGAVLDLTVLFDPKQLRVVADKIKEDTVVSPLQQHHTQLTRWLEDRRTRGAETVTLMQFIDSITNKGVSKEFATEIFQQFDVAGEGVIDLDYLHEMLDLSSRSISGFTGVRSDLQTVNKLLQDCILAPGFIDAFTSGKTVQANHGQQIFKFMCQNRALSVSMPLPALRGFITTTDMRIKVLNTHLNALKERADSKKREPTLQADEILKPINRCFTAAEVSSNRNDASKLIDNDNGTYWQSDGPARSHWVRLTIPSNVVLKQLSMYVVSSDQSYMPHHVVVYGGRDESNLRELNDVRIPNHITGDFTLLENVKVPYQIIQISIKRCHSDGCDTRIRQVKAVGYRVVKSKGVSVIDATAMWYLSVLASTAQAALPIAPQLRDSIIEHTRMSLSHMGPLSLSSSSGERPGFLSNNVMEQMERFLTTIICMDGCPKADELVVLLEFALSRGSLGSILDVMKLILKERVMKLNCIDEFVTIHRNGTHALKRYHQSLEKIDQEYPASTIFRSLVDTEEKSIRKHGQKLSISLLSCDGGSKEATSNAGNVLTDNWKSDAYLTETGKTRCNMAFGLKSGNLIQLTRIFLKEKGTSQDVGVKDQLSKGNIGPKSGLIFVFDSDNIKDESGVTLFQPLEEYDDWTEEQYKSFKESCCDRIDLKPFQPVGYFNVDKDFSWKKELHKTLTSKIRTDIDVVVDHIKTGSCVVIKFLGPRQPSAERLGIIGIQLFGYEVTDDALLQQNKLEEGTSQDVDVKNQDLYKRKVSDNGDDMISGYTLFLQTLHFLQVMCRDAANYKPNKDSPQDKETMVDIHDISMQQLWSLYTYLTTNVTSSIASDSKVVEEASIAEEMLLGLFHIALPYLRPSAQKLKETKRISTRSKKEEQEKAEIETRDFSSKVFQSLCDIVDKKSSTKGVHELAKLIILDGAEVFFPDAQTRRAHLLSLVDKVMEDGKAVSLSYTFESLCRFFSNKDASGLLGLPDCLPQTNFQPESVVHVMTTLVGVAYRECELNDISSLRQHQGVDTVKHICGVSQERTLSKDADVKIQCTSQIADEVGYDIPSNLVLLLCAMQKSLLAWCHFQCDQSDSRDTAAYILTQYIEMISGKCDQALLILENKEEKMKVIDRMENSFASIAMRQLILFLNLFSSADINFIPLLRHLQPLAFTLGRIAVKLPEIFTQSASSSSVSTQPENTVLREWELESEHDYDNNMNYTKVFNCPGCTSFRVEFDPKCQTERRYDYLEFTDSSGCKRRFDQSVGTDKWPLTVNFQSGQRLHVLFHSDGSNTAWGYKFKKYDGLREKGTFQNVDVKVQVFAIGSPDVAVSWIFDLHLNISRCFGIFCGNALNSKKALGIGRAVEEENEEERALLHSELWASLFRGGYMIGKLERSLSGFHRNNPSDSSLNMFLNTLVTGESEKSKEFLERCKVLHTGQKIGSVVVDAAVNAVFAALLWHTQEIREVTTAYIGECPPKDIHSSILQAYSSAESIRRILVERRQKLLVKTEEHVSDNSQQSPIDPDSPVVSCREKAMFLLKFAGLSKFCSRKQSLHGIERRTSNLNRNSKSFLRQDSHEQKRSSHNYDEPPDKYPSFQLILDFVTNESLSHKKIHGLLQHRSKYANTISNVYTYAAEYINHMTESENLQISCILFLQSMLSCQDFFPLHYGDYLNGCGLEQENGVRNAFYSFIRKLAAGLASNMDAIPSLSSSAMFQCAQAYLLHFLDVEWKTYDYNFVSELDLPYILIRSMQGASVPSEVDEEEAELKMYERHKRFFKEARKQSIDAWCTEHREKAPLDIQRDINLFIARYSADLAVVITCDGCQETIKGSRYRCLSCTDMDLCTKCFRNGVKPDEHNNQHVVIDLRFTCDGCGAFIVETRMHCNECSDFDLCLGCFKTENWPRCHHSSHAMTRSRLIPKGIVYRILPTKASKGASLQTYIHYHSWLQFCGLTLLLSESLQNRKSQGTDREYIKEAGQLLLNCMEKLVECLIATQTPVTIPGRENSLTDRTKKVKFEERVLQTILAKDSIETDIVETTIVDNTTIDNLVPVIGALTKPSSQPQVTGHLLEPTPLSGMQSTDDDSCYALTSEGHKDSVLAPPLPDLETDSEEDDAGKGTATTTADTDTERSTDLSVSVAAAAEKSTEGTDKSTLEAAQTTGENLKTELTADSKEIDTGTVVATSVVSSEPTTTSNPIESTTSSSSTNEVTSNVTGTISSVTETSTTTTATSSESSSTSTATETIVSSSSTTPPSTSSTAQLGVSVAATEASTTRPLPSIPTTASNLPPILPTASDIIASRASMPLLSGSSSGFTMGELNQLADGIMVAHPEAVVSNEDIDFEKTTTTDKENKEDTTATVETTLHEKILALIGAIIPANRNMSMFPSNVDFASFISKQLLPVLFTIVSDKDQTSRIRMIALGVLSKILHCFGPQVSDTAISVVKECEISSEEETGRMSARYLFDLGAECLKNADIDSASGVESILRSLWCDKNWKNSIAEHAKLVLFELTRDSKLPLDDKRGGGKHQAHGVCDFLQEKGTSQDVDVKNQDPSLPSLFSLMFLAGFPDIFRIGMLCTVKEVGNEPKNVVVLNYSAEDVMVSVMNFKNRKKIVVKETNIEIMSTFHEIHDSNRLPLLLDIIKRNAPVKGSSLSLERLWVLSLACKALLNVLKTGVSKDDLTTIVQSQILSSIVSLACQGTGFSKHWLLRDLEVLSWKLYKSREKPSSSAEENLSTTQSSDVVTTSKSPSSTTPSAVASSPAVLTTPASVVEANATSTTPVIELKDDALVDTAASLVASNATSTTEVSVAAECTTASGTTIASGATLPKSPLDGLDEETKLCMETIHDALNCPYPLLRAIYEHNGQDREKLLEEVQRGFDGTAGCIIRASDEVRELAKQWEKKEEEPVAPVIENKVPVDSSVDTGILKFHPQTIEFKDLQAKPEGGENSNTLISSLTEEEINETMARQRRVKSSELLKKELENTSRKDPREFAEKVNFAVAVGYCRHLVGWLFTRWQETDDIMTNMLENVDPQNIVGLLDLIQSTESKEHFQKVVFNFIRCCNKHLVQPLALSAVQCMSEVRLATESRESDHKYKNNAKIEDKVHIPGATSLFIRFDERCSTEYSCDELVLSSSSSFYQNRRVFSGSSDWQDFEMPGDTVYYRFTSDSSNNDWGWKFIVTAGQLGRFETGCSILSALLAQDLHFARRLPLKQLWSWLIVVACNQVGQQRLMATGLLLRLLQISAGDPYVFGGDAEPTPEKNRPNLTLLRPLWTLYTNSIETDTGTSLALISPVIRGLSELFLVVENVAQDWGEADDLVAGLATNDKLSKAFTKVVKNIAAIGVAIGLPNKASEMLQNAKEIPPSPTRKPPASKPKKQLSTIQLRITGDDGSDIEDSDDEMFLDEEDDTTQDEDDDDEDEDDGDTEDSSDCSDLSQPEPPP